MKIKRMADGDSGGGAAGGVTPPPQVADWRPLVPESLRGEAMLKDIKDVPGLVQGYMHAQRLVGADKIVKPNDKWTQTDWDSFYNTVGRPASADKYSFKLPENLPQGLKVDETKMKDAFTTLHKAGLTDKQANDVLGYYFSTMTKDVEGYKDLQVQDQKAALATLREEFKDQTDVKLNIAQSVVRKFGGDEMGALLEQTGLGNNPALIRMFAKIGEVMLDDKALGAGNNLILTDANSAKTEISKLKGDKDFINQLSDRQNPGYKAALEKWEGLHKIAYPNTAT